MTTENNKKESEIPMLGADGVVKFRKELNFGDTIINGYASERNPHRSGIVVRVKEKSIQATDGKGDFWEIVLDKESRLKLSSAPATPPSIEGEQESELNAIVDKNVKLFKNLRVIELAKELGHETINEKCFICGQSYNIPIDEYLSYKEKQFRASQFTASKEKEYRELLEEVDYYLSRTHYEKGKPVYSNNIGAGSILHKKIKEALNK